MPNPKTTFTLSKFGEVVPIGVKGFADLITKNKEELEGYDSKYHLKSLVLYELSHEKVEIREADSESLMMFGHIVTGSVDDAVLGDQKVPYLIVRKQIERVKDFILNRKNVILCSDMGNGKSIFIDELHSYLTVSSIDCYRVSDSEGFY